MSIRWVSSPWTCWLMVHEQRGHVLDRGHPGMSSVALGRSERGANYWMTAMKGQTIEMPVKGETIEMPVKRQTIEMLVKGQTIKHYHDSFPRWKRWLKMRASSLKTKSLLNAYKCQVYHKFTSYDLLWEHATLRPLACPLIPTWVIYNYRIWCPVATRVFEMGEPVPCDLGPNVLTLGSL